MQRKNAARGILIEVPSRKVARPMPPEDVTGLTGPVFVPADALRDWTAETFISPFGPMANKDHEHLLAANIAFLWTSVENARKGRRVIGTAEPGKPQGTMGKWAKARAAQQINEWFGMEPDFIITIDALWWLDAGDAECCALVEHELYHCAQERDEYGSPKFSKSTGRPSYAMRGHDVEAFIGVAARYGAIEPGVQDLMKALSNPPMMTANMIGLACGACQAKAA